MQYNSVIHGKFVDRPNRFIAHVEIDGKMETVHVKNTGRCKELLIPGVDVVLEKSDNPARKTAYDLVCVYKEGIGLINIDSQAPNKVVGEWLSSGEYFKDIVNIKPEFTYGESRLDFKFDRKDKTMCLMEVKGVTLEKDKVCYFPDAPTIRGVKHLKELTNAVKKGYECYIAFVIQMEGVDIVYPNRQTHPEFETAFNEAVAAGVKILYLGCSVTENSLCISRVFSKDKNKSAETDL